MNHYQGKKFDVKTVLENFLTLEELRGFYVSNVLKYILRYKNKNGVEDLKKAQDYLKWLVATYEQKQAE